MESLYCFFKFNNSFGKMEKTHLSIGFIIFISVISASLRGLSKHIIYFLKPNII